MAEYKRLNLLLIEGVNLDEAAKKVTLPSDVPAISSLPAGVKQYLEGTNGSVEATLAYSVDGREITVSGVHPYNENVLRLIYNPIPKTGEIVRP